MKFVLVASAVLACVSLWASPLEIVRVSGPDLSRGRPAGRGCRTSVSATNPALSPLSTWSIREDGKIVGYIVAQINEQGELEATLGALPGVTPERIDELAQAIGQQEGLSSVIFDFAAHALVYVPEGAERIPDTARVRIPVRSS